VLVTWSFRATRSVSSYAWICYHPQRFSRAFQRSSPGIPPSWPFALERLCPQSRQFPAKVQQVAIHWATPGTALRTDKQDRRQKRVRQETKPEAT
jgi:hypothetical protein